MKERLPSRVWLAMAALVVGVFSASFSAQEAGRKPAPSAAQKPAATPHRMYTADELKWGPAPAALPPGAQMAVVDGDPSVKGRGFVIRAKMPDGYRVPPHWHPADENVTVLSGTLMAGMGDKFDQGSMKALTAGGFSNKK